MLKTKTCIFEFNIQYELVNILYLTLECLSKLVSSKGVERLYGIIKDMTGERASPIFKICWRYLTPLISLVSPTFSHEYMCIKNVPLYSIVPFYPIQYVQIPRLLLDSVIIFSQGTFICSLIWYQPLTYNRVYIYPDWAYTLGWALAFSSILLVPGWMLYKLGTGTGSLRQVGKLHDW